MYRTLLAALLLLSAVPAAARDLSAISNQEASGGLKEALIQAAHAAVGRLGVTDGYFKNPRVKIPLPESLQKMEKGLRLLGMGKQADELVLRMNRAAEAAVPEARALLVDAVKQMTVEDAKNILTGGDDAATHYFKRKTSAPLFEKFLPIVTAATRDVELAQQYNRFAAAGQRYGLVRKEQANLEQYVTHQALEGLYLMMGEEEKAIRKDPHGASTRLIRKVFGALGN